ncbi:MAG: hypothetical protein IT285_10655 [Bdellovibrionales bacterium]|nr:hypothetical protein [Bdellovibrionales bacterium]
MSHPSLLIGVSMTLLAALGSGCAHLPWDGPAGGARRDLSGFHHSPDVELGMPMEDVKGAWGEPRRVQMAGNPEYGNQRWIYELGGTSTGAQRAARIVYFEEGQVVGWETTHDF